MSEKTINHGETGDQLNKRPEAAIEGAVMTVVNYGLIWEGDRAALAKAFIVGQTAMEAVKKAATNPAFKTKYADLSEVVEAVVPALNKAGIGVIQTPGYDGDWVSVSTTFLHEGGSSVTSVLKLRPSKTDPQGVGSAITYGRRYSLLAMTGAAPEDDDGQASSGPIHQRQQGDRSEPSTSLASRADVVVGCVNAAKDSATLEKVWSKSSAVCADLDLKDPDKLAVITALYEARRDELAANPFDNQKAA